MRSSGCTNGTSGLHEGEQHIVLMQDAVELQIVQQRARHAACFGREIDRRAFDSRRRSPSRSWLENRAPASARAQSARPGCDDLPATVLIKHVDADGHGHGQPAAVRRT